MRVSRATAKKAWGRGYPVRLVHQDDGYSSRYGSCVVGWSKTFEEFEEHQTSVMRRHESGPLIWEQAPAWRRTHDEAAGFIFRREPFDTISNITARTIMRGVGDLPEQYQGALIQTANYIVYSYDTPIGWVNQEDGKPFMPPVRYSLTTTQHQSLVAHAFGISFASTETTRAGYGRTPYTERRGW